MELFVGGGGVVNLEEPVRMASPTRINLEEPVRVANKFLLVTQPT